MNNQPPKVSVLIPVHRDNHFLDDAVQSITQQTYENLEILILDNSDVGLNLENRTWRKSVQVIKLDSTFGLSETLNAGFRYSTGEFVARMDYDDVSYPERIEKQVRFMQEHPEIGISGSWAEVIGENIDQNVIPGGVIERPTSSEDVIQYLLYKNPLIHPSVIFRKSVIEEFKFAYRAKFDSAEDLDLWARASRVTKIANLPEPLIKYRLHVNQYSRNDSVNSEFARIRIQLRHALWCARNSRKLRIYAIKRIFRIALVYPRLKMMLVFSDKFDKFKAFK